MLPLHLRLHSPFSPTSVLAEWTLRGWKGAFLLSQMHHHPASCCWGPLKQDSDGLNVDVPLTMGELATAGPQARLPSALPTPLPALLRPLLSLHPLSLPSTHRAALLVSTWAGKSHFPTSDVDLGGSSCTPTALEDIEKAREFFRHMPTGSDDFCPRNSFFSQKAPSTLMASTHLLQ